MTITTAIIVCTLGSVAIAIEVAKRKLREDSV